MKFKHFKVDWCEWTIHAIDLQSQLLPNEIKLNIAKQKFHILDVLPKNANSSKSIQQLLHKFIMPAGCMNPCINQCRSKAFINFTDY